MIELINLQLNRNQEIVKKKGVIMPYNARHEETLKQIIASPLLLA